MFLNIFITVLICLSYAQHIKCNEDSNNNQPSSSEDSTESVDKNSGENENELSSSGEINNESPPSTYKSTHSTDKPTLSTGKPTLQIPVQELYGLCATMFEHVIAEIGVMNRTLYNLRQKNNSGDPTCLETSTEKNLTINEHGQDFIFYVNIKGCVSESKLKYKDLKVEQCGEKYQGDLKKRIYRYLKNIDQITDQFPEDCPCLNCQPLSTAPSSTSPTATIIDKVTSSWTSTTSKTSSEMDPTADKITEHENKGSRLSNLKVVLVGIASFLAGILVTALFLWLFHLKRTSGLCFREPEKTPQRMTSEKRTKMVLAKHMTLEKKDSPATENIVYFTNESDNKQLENSTGMYEDIVPEQPFQNVYSTITTSGTNPSAPQIEEHVYKGLDLVSQTDDNGKQLKGNDHKDKVGLHTDTANLSVGGESGADVFDHTRESTVSGQDYFILQNENFRNSVQTHSISTPIGHEEDSDEKFERDYFVLEKQ